jgi:hypothetical protein
MPSWRLDLGAVLLLAAVAGIAYANSFGVGFLLDSRILIRHDPRLRALTLDNLRSVLTQDYWWAGNRVDGLYRPLTTLSYLIDAAVLGHGDRPAGYHAVNLLLHWGNAALGYVLLLRLLGGRVPAFLAAALFAVHPVATEAVTNLVGRADLLATLAVLGGLLLHARGPAGAHALRAQLATALSLGLGLLAKESAIVLIAVVPLYDLVFRVRAAARWRDQIPFRAYAGFGAALLLVWWLRARLYAAAPPEPTAFLDNPLVGADFWTARLTAMKVLGQYVALLVWPAHLSWDYSYDQVPLVQPAFTSWENAQALLALAGFAGALVLAVWTCRRLPALAFLLAFFLVALLPTANLLFLIGTTKAERLLYLPSLAFAGLVALGVTAATRRLAAPPLADRVAAAVLVGLIAAGALRTVARNHDWQDELRLAESGVAASPRSLKTHLWLAQALATRYGAGDPAQLDRMIAHGEQALAIMDARPLALTAQHSHVPLALGTYYKAKGMLLRREDAAAAREWITRARAVLERAAAIEGAHADARQRARARGLPADQIAAVGTADLYYHLAEAYSLLGETERASEARLRMQKLRRR